MKRVSVHGKHLKTLRKPSILPLTFLFKALLLAALLDSRGADCQPSENVSTCKSISSCPGGECAYTVNFTSSLGNVPLTTGLVSSFIDRHSSLPPQQCALYQRLPVCLGRGQRFSLSLYPDSFRTSSGSHQPQCTLQDLRVVSTLGTEHVLHAYGIAPACLLSQTGCDCSILKEVDWGMYNLAPLVDGTVPTTFAKRTSCRPDASQPAFAVFALACPLKVDQWVSADVTLKLDPNEAFCSMSNLSIEAKWVFYSFMLLVTIMSYGFCLLLTQAVAIQAVRNKKLPDTIRTIAASATRWLRHLFDVHGVLYMDAAESRDRFFTVNVMTSVVLTIAVIAFTPQLNADSSVAFQEPDAELSELDLNRVAAFLTKDRKLLLFLRRLLRPLLVLVVSACLGLWAWLILLVNYTAPPPWTRDGAVKNAVEKASKSWRTKYVLKKVVSLLALLLLDAVCIVILKTLLRQFFRWRFKIPNCWSVASVILFYIGMHLKFVEVVLLELSGGGMCSCFFCAFVCFPSIRRRYQPCRSIKYQSIPVAQLRDSLYKGALDQLPAGHDTAGHNAARHGTAGHGTAEQGTAAHGTVGHGTAGAGPDKAASKQGTGGTVQPRKNSFKPTTSAGQAKLGDQPGIPVLEKRDDMEAMLLNSVQKEEPSQMLWSAFLVNSIKVRLHSALLDVSEMNQFRYSSFFLAAVATSVMLAMYFFLQNLERVTQLQRCIDMNAPCARGSGGEWLPVIVTAASALLSQDSAESAQAKLLGSTVRARLDSVMASTQFDGAAILQGPGNSSLSVQELSRTIQACDPQRINALLAPSAGALANRTVASNITASFATASQLGINIPALVQTMMLSELQPVFSATCPQVSPALHQTMQGFGVDSSSVVKVEEFLRQLRRSVRVGGYVGCSLGLVVAMLSLAAITQVYRAAMIRLHKERTLQGLFQSRKKQEEMNSTMELYLLTEAARQALPLRAVFFYGVMFSSVLLQMIVVSLVFSTIITMVMLPWFWMTIGVQVAAYLVTILVALAISLLVVGLLGRNLAPGGRIGSPASWLVFYIIFSCAYIVLGIFIASVRFLFALLASFIYVARIDQCINLLGSRLDPAYNSFLGMVKMYGELRGSELRNRRYTGNWGRVRRLVFERQDLMQEELNDRTWLHSRKEPV